MSLMTWKKEFYSGISKVSKKDAVAHSLKKWKGLTTANLEKHGLEIDCNGSVYNPKTLASFDIDCKSCALCYHYNNYERGVNHDCVGCPVNISGNCCSHKDSDPYSIWCYDNNPQPMIDLLSRLDSLKT